MGQQQSNPRHNESTHRHFHNKPFKNLPNIEHQGILKLRAVPFKNCIEIQTDGGTPMFLQNVSITLKDLLDSRLYTNKLFPKQDIQRLIQNLSYTLAFLQQQGAPYKHITSQNVFYDEGNFKLLPNQLISESTYQKFLSFRKNVHQLPINAFVPLSPEMIIAYRCKEKSIMDSQIIDKSNVFYFGLLLLEVTTLLPSYECYDVENCDIFDEFISERIQMIQQYYSKQIATIIANMLDYDFDERMTLKELSIFINREFSLMAEKNCQKYSRSQFNPPNYDNPQKNFDQCQNNPNDEEKRSVFSQKTNISQTSTQKRAGKTNKVYMNQHDDGQTDNISREGGNSIYLKNQNFQKRVNQPPERQFYPKAGVLKQISNNRQYKRQESLVKNPYYQADMSQKSTKKLQFQRRGQIDNQQENDRMCKKESQISRQVRKKDHKDYLGYIAPKNRQSNVSYNRNSYENTERDSYLDQEKQNTFGNERSHQEYLSSSRGKIYNAEDDYLQQTPHLKKYNQSRPNNESLNRIKSQIQRSRKLIQQFKKGENCRF